MFFLSFLNKSSEFENHKKKNVGELETKLIDSFHENLKKESRKFRIWRRFVLFICDRTPNGNSEIYFSLKKYNKITGIEATNVAAAIEQMVQHRDCCYPHYTRTPFLCTFFICRLLFFFLLFPEHTTNAKFKCSRSTHPVAIVRFFIIPYQLVIVRDLFP